MFHVNLLIKNIIVDKKIIFLILTLDWFIFYSVQSNKKLIGLHFLNYLVVIDRTDFWIRTEPSPSPTSSTILGFDTQVKLHMREHNRKKTRLLTRTHSKSTTKDPSHFLIIYFAFYS